MKEIMMMDPLSIFAEWYDEAGRSCKDHDAMAVATADADGKPSVRILLLKQFGAEGFVFYTNLGGRKSKDLQNNAAVALCFFWAGSGRQIRIEGVAERVDDAQADAYFASRPRESQIGAWGSKQSEPLENRDLLLQQVDDYKRKFSNKVIPRPPFWTGFCVRPTSYEFWTAHESRLNERLLFTLNGDSGWAKTLLYP